MTFGGDYRFENDFSVITKYRFTKEEARSAHGYQIRNYLVTGLAYRPVRMNWFNALAKFELRSDNNFYLSPFVRYLAAIVSAHGYVEPVQRLELGLKYAYRTAHEVSGLFEARTHTFFYLVSARFDISQTFDIGGEYRLLWQTEARDLLNGYSAEVGVAITKDVKVSGGYNFKGYKDRDQVDYRLWSQGPYMRVSLKFDPVKMCGQSSSSWSVVRVVTWSP